MHYDDNPIHTHAYSSEWSHDGTYHWHDATCGHDVVSGKEKHQFIENTIPATFDEDGLITYTCSVCGYSYSKKGDDKLKHNYSSGWSHDESTHWHACTDSGYENLKSAEASHTFVDTVTFSTYESQGYTTHVCSVCGYSYVDSYTDTLTHNYSSGWSHDESTHWHACTDSGYENLKSAEASHTFVDTVTPATGQSGGYTTHACSICGYSYRDNETSVLTYKITWKNWDGTILETDTDVAYGSTPTYDGTTPTKDGSSQYSYTWTGWTPSVTSVTSDAIYTATFSSSINSYTITWKNWDGTILETDTDVAYGSTPTYDGAMPTKESDSLYSYSFSGWSPALSTVNDNATYTATYSQVKIGVSLTITYTLYNPKTNKLVKTYTEKPTDIANVSTSSSYSFNTYVDLFSDPNEGYTFVGWYYDGLILSSDTNYKYMMWDQDIELEARFKYTTYSLHVFANHSENGLILIKNGNYSSYTNEDTTSQYYTESVTIAAYSKNNTRFLGWYDENNDLISTNAVYTFDMSNGGKDIEAKWNYFTISYNLNGGTNNDSNPKSYNIDLGKVVFANPSKNGYVFMGWKCNGEDINSIDCSLAKDIILTAVWQAISYSITYNLNGGENNSNNPSEYTSDDAITLLSPSKIGYTFSGWYSDSSFTKQIIKITKGSYGDVALYAKWTVISYSITYNINGGANSSINPSTYTIEDSIVFADPTFDQDGYHFDGWYDKNDNQVTGIPKGTIGDISIEAKWSPNLNNLLVTSEDKSKGTASIVSGSGYTGESITVVATPINDCVFKGWFSGNTRVSENCNYSFVMPAYNYSLTAKFFTKDEETEWKVNHGVTISVSEDGKTATYGLYPQSLVTDENLISSLETVTKADGNGWYYYDDEYYAKVSSTISPPSTVTFDNGELIVRGKTYWFKCEPLIWNIVVDMYSNPILLSSKLIDNQRFYNGVTNKPRKINGNDVYPNNYQYSDIRTWLNNDFKNTAFYLESSLLLRYYSNNSAITTNSTSYSPYCCNETTESIFLPSYRDYINSHAGFPDNTNETSTRECKTTEYARAVGSRCSMDADYLYNGSYYTRSPWYSGYGSSFSDIAGIDYKGKISYEGMEESVRPAIRIELPK